MRKTLSHWMIAALIGLSVAGTGCRSGSGWGTPSWMSWGSKPATTTTPSALASKPSTQLPPSPSATMSPNGYAGAAGANANTTTPYAKSYSTQPASTTPGAAGYHTGPYNTGATGPAGGYGGAPAAPGTYGAPSNPGAYPTTPARSTYPATGGGSPMGYNAPPTNYGASANVGAANGYGQPVAQPGVGSYGSPAGNGIPASNYPATSSGGAAAYQAANNATVPASGGVVGNSSGYRPGSTGRSVSADGVLSNPPAIQPADYQSGPAPDESIPEYTPSPAPPTNSGAGGGSFIPPSGQ